MAVNLSGPRLLTVLWCGWGIHGEREGESEKDYMTEGGGNKLRIQRNAIEMISLSSLTPAAKTRPHTL